MKLYWTNMCDHPFWSCCPYSLRQELTSLFHALQEFSHVTKTFFPSHPTPLEKGQVDCARITASTLQQILTPFCVPLVDCAAVVIQGRRREFRQRPAVPGEVQASRVIRVLMQELIINVILGYSPPRNTDRPGTVPSSRLEAKMTTGNGAVC